MTGRAERVHGHFGTAGIDLLLVTDLVDVRWLTGFTGSSGLVVTGPDVARLVTDFRYLERAARESPGWELVRAPSELLGALEDGWPAGELRLGFQDDRVTVRQHLRLRELLPSRVELVAAGGLVAREREVKDAGEVAAIRAAAALADEAFAEVVEQGLAGRTERQVALALEQAMRVRGAEPSFATIVASGPRGALPHATPGDDVIARDVLVTVDWGARLDGYCSDCTRTVATGEPPAELRAIHDLVRRAQAAALEAVRPGPEGRAVDAVARGIIAGAGHGEHFGHSLGHGVGLEVHEGPRLSVQGREALRPGHVVTVEPGVYVAGTGGVRIEDLVVVTEDGCDVLSGHPKDLWVTG